VVTGRDQKLAEPTVGRLSLYRRALRALAAEGVQNVYSHQLAALLGVTAPQVRRDLMAVGSYGNSKHGYGVQGLLAGIADVLDEPGGQNVALVGVGNLGRAILSYFTGRPNLKIVAAFDNDPRKAGLVISGCRCYTMQEMCSVCAANGINTAIVTVPAGQAQGVADLLVAAGARGLLNFAPTKLRVPPHVHVEQVDMTTSLEKAAFFARRPTAS